MNGGCFGAPRSLFPFPTPGARTGRFRAMSRPTQFEHYRYLGDKRTLVVYDLDLYGEGRRGHGGGRRVMASERFIAISPQTLAEARNRGYRPHRSFAPTPARARAEGSASASGSTPAGSASRMPLCLASNATSESTGSDGSVAGSSGRPS